MLLPPSRRLGAFFLLTRLPVALGDSCRLRPRLTRASCGLHFALPWISLVGPNPSPARRPSWSLRSHLVTHRGVRRRRPVCPLARRGCRVVGPTWHAGRSAPDHVTFKSSQPSFLLVRSPAAGFQPEVRQSGSFRPPAGQTRRRVGRDGDLRPGVCGRGVVVPWSVRAVVSWLGVGGPSGPSLPVRSRPEE